jgi:hypothetical protein
MFLERARIVATVPDLGLELDEVLDEDGLRPGATVGSARWLRGHPEGTTIVRMMARAPAG